VDLPPIEIRVFWHAKVHQDPANRWLRELIVRQFGEGGSGTGDQSAEGPSTTTSASSASAPRE
jgi:hypothetical protein